MGDLINELQDAINEDSDKDIIDSFADFLQVDFTFDNCLRGKIVFGRLCYFYIYYYSMFELQIFFFWQNNLLE